MTVAGTTTPSRLVYRGPDARVYANEYALPRVFLVAEQRVVGGGEAALGAVSSLGFDGRRVAVTERAVRGVPQAHSDRTPPPGSARLVTYEPERVVAMASAARPSLLVLTDSFYPGWKATVDGRSTPIERVDYLLRGLPIPPGTHRVEFRYEPASYRAGWIISLLSALAVLAAAVVGWRCGQRHRGQRPTG
jgi:Bacterial membrane protein YfhO